MKKYLLLIVIVCLNFNLKAQQTINDFIYFASDQYEIMESSRTKLEVLIESISELEKPQIHLTGHTDDQGDQNYNLSLSENRVNAVSDYFKNRGFQNTPIELNYYGETIPVANNETEKDRQYNRRVEVTIIEQAKEVFTQIEIIAESPVEIPEPIIETLEIEYANPREVLADFGSEPQLFCIQNDRDILLQGEDGTILFFKAGSFNPKEVTCDCIEIQLKEFYTPEQIILNNLNTQSGSRLLETQGAVKVEAYCDNKLLNLKRGKKMDLYFSNLDDNNDYQLFLGKEDEDGVDWVKNTRNSSSQFLAGFGGQSGRGMSFNSSFCDYNFFLKRWVCKWKSKKRTRKGQRNLLIRMTNLGEAYGGVDFEGMKIKVDNKTLRLFTSNKMGYINCDRFLTYPKRQLADFYIKEESKSESQKMITSIVFQDMNSVMAGSMDTKGRHWYFKIPKEKKVWIVVVKKENGAYYLAIKDHVLDDKPIEGLVFEQVSGKKLSDSLAAIGW